MIFVSNLKFLHHPLIIFETSRGFYRAFTPASVGHKQFWCSIFVGGFLSSLGIDDRLVETEAALLTLLDDSKLVEHHILKLDDCCL
jgi:hypothetical protein